MKFLTEESRIGSVTELANSWVGEKAQETLDTGVSDQRRLELHDTMTDLNRKLCVAFLHYHALKGVDEPMAVFRVSGKATHVGNPRFDALLAALCASPHHETEIKSYLATQREA